MRRFTVLILAFSAILLALSGIVLFIAPSNRIAIDISWSFLFLGRNQWLSLHLTSALIVLVLTCIHLIVYNWKVFVSYLRPRGKKVLGMQPSLLYSLLLLGVIFLGSALLLPPFHFLQHTREAIKDHYRAEYGIERRQDNDKNQRYRRPQRSSREIVSEFIKHETRTP
jgi:hypothetical protein